MSKFQFPGVCGGDEASSNSPLAQNCKINRPGAIRKILTLIGLALATSAVSVQSATIFKEAGGVAVIEAENFTARTPHTDGHHWQVIPNENIPGSIGAPVYANPRGSYVQSLPDSGINHNINDGTTIDPLQTPPFIDYKVNISTPGEYSFWMRWGGWDGAADSIYAQIIELNTTSPQWYRFQQVSADFATAWQNMGAPDANSGGPGGEVPAVWTIPTAGVYTIRLTMREDGSAVDTVLLQLSSMTAPSIPGPAESDLQEGFVLGAPANALSTPGTTATFNVLAKTGPGGTVTYQWQSQAPGATSFSNISGATSASYTTPPTTVAMNGTQYRVQATSSGVTLTSLAATLTTDNSPPTLLRSFSGPANTTLTITFSEPLDTASAQTAANYVLSGGLTVTSATLSADKKIVYLKTSIQTPSTAYTVTVNGVKDVAGNALTGATSSFKGPIAVLNQLLARKFEGIQGTAVNALVLDPRYPDSPTSATYWDSFGPFPGTADNLGENYGMEVTGFVIPTTTADYEFYIASDDASALYLSTDESPANARLIAQETTCCRAFTHAPGGLSSASIHLEAGKQYYVRAYLKEGGGGDFLYVGWRNSVDHGDITIPPGAAEVILGDNLATGYDPSVSITITQQPTNLTTAANTPAPFTIAYNAYSPVLGTVAMVQWQNAPSGSTTFTDIADATNLTYRIPLAAAADNGLQFRAVLTAGDLTVTSSTATLTVTTDNVAPTVTSFAGFIKIATITFSEPVDPVTAGALSSYSISPGGSITAATVTTSPEGYGTVTLDLSGLTAGATYNLTIKDVKDAAGNTMAQVVKTFAAFDYFSDFNTPTLPPLTGIVGSANIKPSGGFDGGGFLELTPATGSLNGSIGIDDVLAGGTATNFTARFKLFIGNGSGNAADGLSFSIADSLTVSPVPQNVGEDGAGGGLTISFDTYDNGAAAEAPVTAPSIDIKWGGIFIANTPVPKATLVNNQWVDVFIQMTGDEATAVGHVTVIHNNTKVHDNVQIDGWAPIVTPKVLIGHRTGGEFERAAIDNLALIYNADVPIPQPPTVAITAPTDNANLTAGAPATITVNTTPAGAIAKVEYFANGNKIGESTASPYSFTLPAVPAGIYVVTARVTDINGVAVTSSPITVTAHPAGAPVVLYLRATGGANATDIQVMNRLISRGLDVINAPALPSVSTDADGKALVVVSSTVGSGDIADKFRDVATGVLTWENALADNFLFTLNDATNHAALGGQTTIDITPAGAAHPIGAGLSAGTIQVVSIPAEFSWGQPASSATIIANITGTGNLAQSSIYAFEKGALLIDGVSTAAGRRVYFLMGDATFGALNATGLQLFDAAVDWARATGTVAPVISFSKSANQLTITWTNGGTLQSAPAVTGPWTTASTTGTHIVTIPSGAGAEFYRIVRTP